LHVGFRLDSRRAAVADNGLRVECAFEGLRQGAFNLAAFFNLNFNVVNLARDLARRANDQALFTDDGIVQLASYIDDFGRNAASDLACWTNQDFLSCEVAFNDTIDDGFRGDEKDAFNDDTVTNNYAFK